MYSRFRGNGVAIPNAAFTRQTTARYTTPAAYRGSMARARREREVGGRKSRHAVENHVPPPMFEARPTSRPRHPAPVC